MELTLKHVEEALKRTPANDVMLVVPPNMERNAKEIADHFNTPEAEYLPTRRVRMGVYVDNLLPGEQFFLIDTEEYNSWRCCDG